MTKSTWLVQGMLILALVAVPTAAQTGEARWQQVGLDGVSIQTVVVDPANEQILYAGGGPEFGSGLWKSVDGGASWLPINDGLGEIHRVNTVAVDPSSASGGASSTLLLGVFKLGGPNLFRSTDGGATWQPSTTGLPNTTDEVSSIVFDPQNPTIVYAGLNGPIGGTVKSLDGGQSWSDISLGIPDGFCARSCVLDVALDPTSPSTVYATMPALAELYKSTDGGATWSATGVPLLPERVELVGAAPMRIYTTGTVPSQGGFARSLDGGGSWQNLTLQPGLPAVNDGSFRSLAVDPTNPDVLWMLVEDFGPFPTTVEAVHHSTDGGLTWAIEDEGLESVRVLDLLYHGRTVLASTDDGVFQRAVEPAPEACAPGSTVLCLQESRFRVEVDFEDPRGNGGPGKVVPGASDDSGLFWFFSPDNWELLVKVLDGCAINQRFWVFSAATTNVEYTLRVTDTQTGAEVSYVNPQGQAAPAITDTGAFVGCP